eukprot:GHVL01024080.1.p1 GENE.GHVL01024080.1~~GHVL01024080.1.p1  ORF type:complete len:920 (+),score=124.25 GHVL01024080.1:140-2899(+)
MSEQEGPPQQSKPAKVGRKPRHHRERQTWRNTEEVQQSLSDNRACTANSEGKSRSERGRKNERRNDFRTNDSTDFQKDDSNRTFIRKAKNATGVERTDLLQKQMRQGIYECSICISRISRHDPIWSCSNCWAAQHLKCIRGWIKKSNAMMHNGVEWRCPGCSFSFQEKYLPIYTCFCTKRVDPPVPQSNIIPHSCGEVCGKMRNAQCPHPCELLCHPGPCPPCAAIAPSPVNCFCGKSSRPQRCGDENPYFSCQQKCNKELNCRIHKCSLVCHAGECIKCPIKEVSDCYCGAHRKEIECGNDKWSCETICGKDLTCGNHKCKEKCHKGECKTCEFDPKIVKVCPCGKTNLTIPRMSCLDLLPSCENHCGKLLACERHSCSLICHSGPCETCPKSVQIECRCGKTKQPMPCAREFVEVLCKGHCKKKKTCGKHRCLQICCPGYSLDYTDAHLCLEVCGKPLACGIHNCEEFCHIGYCKPCGVVSRQPLHCACGECFISPPVPCGTKHPSCDKKCRKPLECGHLCEEECHYGECSILCTELVSKPCAGGHEQINNVPCHRSSDKLSCGRLCEKTLACGHQCTSNCHGGKCTGCRSLCGIPRHHCDHTCREPCGHPHPCPDIPCPVKVQLTCLCGSLTTSIACGAFSRKPKKSDLPMLSCTDECSRLQSMRQQKEREKLLSDAFHMESHDSEIDCYDEELILFGRDNKRFLLLIEPRMKSCVNCKTPGGVHLPPCDSSLRTFVEEYAVAHFRLTTSSIKEGQDRHKHVVVSATLPECRIPRKLLSDVIDNLIETNVLTPQGISPTYRIIPVGRYGLRDEERNLVIFGEKCPKIYFYDMPPSYSTRTILEALQCHHQVRFRVRWVNNTTAYVELLTAEDARNCFKSITQKNGPSPLKNKARLEIISLFNESTSTRIMQDGWED